ncbi:type II toxin-antitoxin system prevent-host-death family antitoxin [Rhizobium sp. S96]|uniref:type II toxin-antitoxin system Phd/YefM family antitoxin n=1 Tax=Rhizobium sp. S96 TaxID=3055140 RepID=UPI0025AAE2F7|nr:type II toxin-antitoxin system prevent-host-death family antitoxin [Rhizobium sp. S96]MDM9619870.1 type II toxin-antitoxin system prevent-host-death family antitoxin [Rhizobium sp. S96]
MTITVNLNEASLPELLAKVEAGEEVVILRDGVPVARLAPVAADDEKRRQAIEAVRAFRKTMPAITQEEIAEWKATGWR